MNFAYNKGKKKLQHKRMHRTPRGNPFKINANARQRKGRKNLKTGKTAEQKPTQENKQR